MTRSGRPTASLRGSPWRQGFILWAPYYLSNRRGGRNIIGLGAGSESATWDLKVVDPKTRELLLAIHHRAISGTAMTSIDDKLVKWSDRFAAFLAQHALK